MDTTIDPFKKYAEVYITASKQEKGKILDSVTELTGMHRKAVVRKFRVLQMKDSSVPQKIQGRPRTYGTDVTIALKELWELSGRVCGELLYPMIGEYITQCKKYDTWHHSDDVTMKLRMISEPTVKRRVQEFYTKDRETFRKGRTTTKPSSIKAVIPIRERSWHDATVGEGQIDTVVHCGDTLGGDMAYTLNYTDFKTYWIGLRAQMNKGQHATVESLLFIGDTLPFPLVSVHPDTGSEFINWHMKEVCDALEISLTRSRPNHKNDNMCVEERNGHVVRKKIGYIRVDCVESVDLLNQYYDSLCLLFNHFIAVRRTKEKVRVGAKYKRVFEKPGTPYMMVMAAADVSQGDKAALKKIHDALDIFSLKQEMEALLKEIHTMQRKKRGKLY